MSYQEIADALGVSLAKVKSDIHRGREVLKQELSIHGSR
jgi:DNA-directed RNA polymerase specialized sigma24 family protein